MTRLTADEVTTLDEAWRTGSFVVVLDAVEALVGDHRDEAVVMALLDVLDTGPVGSAGAPSDESCRRCGGPNVTWSTPSPLWNRVMRGDDINGATQYSDLVCIACFCELAEDAGVKPKRWRVYADPEPDGLVKVTPSGRVWNVETWLWEATR